MAILRIKIENLKFVSYQGERPNKFMERDVSGNGWTCRINTDTSIIAEKIEQTKTSYIRLKYKISSRGYATLTQFENGSKTELKCFRIYGWPLNGVLCLGNTAYFKFGKDSK